MAANVGLAESQVKRLISHREPFLLLSQAVENVIGERVCVISRQETSHALSNRMLLVEGLGQATALLIRQMDEYKNSGVPVIAAMRNIRWNNCSGIEGMLMYSAALNRALNSRFVIADASAHVGDIEVCSGQLVASFQTVAKGKVS